MFKHQGSIRIILGMNKQIGGKIMIINNDKYVLERESEAPENWKNNVILRKNNLGEVEVVEVKDDVEEGEK